MLLLDIPLALLSVHCHLVTKCTAYALGTGSGIWKPRPHFWVWQPTVSQTRVLQTSHRDSRQWTHQIPLGKVGSQVTRELCNGSLYLPCSRGFSPVFPPAVLLPFLALCPALSCNELQPAGKHSPHRAPCQTAWFCMEAKAAAGLGPCRLCSEYWLLPCVRAHRPSARYSALFAPSGCQWSAKDSEGVCGAGWDAAEPASAAQWVIPELSVTTATHTIWTTQRAIARSFCADSCSRFNCNCFKFVKSLEAWGPTH